MACKPHLEVRAGFQQVPVGVTCSSRQQQNVVAAAGDDAGAGTSGGR
ncbi:MAG: hypothetical protein SV966_12660 [Actinomycetota bacterium]|nr:hypothetical protein [Actinomycetota bacterium]